jgi:hypothetical protein
MQSGRLEKKKRRVFGGQDNQGGIAVRRPLPFPDNSKQAWSPVKEISERLPAWIKKLPLDPAYRPLVIVGVGLTLGVIFGWTVKRR